MKILCLVLVVCIMMISGSCATTSFRSTNSSSWIAKKSAKARGTVRIGTVSAEKSGEWGTLEREVRELLPLYFSEKNYIAVSPGSEADYTAEVRVREREYPKGWKTRHSLSVEVRLWQKENDEQPLPLAAGRTMNQGKETFSSSKTLSSMLRQAVKNAVRGLPSKSRKPIVNTEDEE